MIVREPSRVLNRHLFRSDDRFQREQFVSGLPLASPRGHGGHGHLSDCRFFCKKMVHGGGVTFGDAFREGAADHVALGRLEFKLPGKSEYAAKYTVHRDGLVFSLCGGDTSVRLGNFVGWKSYLIE